MGLIEEIEENLRKAKEDGSMAELNLAHSKLIIAQTEFFIEIKKDNDALRAEVRKLKKLLRDNGIEIG